MYDFVCIAGRTSSRMGDADPATPTRGGADPATSTNSSRRQGQTAQDAQEHALYSVPHVPWHQGNREVPGCGPTCGMQGTSVPLRASAVPLIAEFAPWGQMHHRPPSASDQWQTQCHGESLGNGPDAIAVDQTRTIYDRRLIQCKDFRSHVWR